MTPESLIFFIFGVGRVLAAEILLGLALQRGSLQHILEWIEMAMFAAAESVDNQTVDEHGNVQKCHISGPVLFSASLTLNQSGNETPLDLLMSENVSLYEASMLLMKEVPIIILFSLLEKLVCTLFIVIVHFRWLRFV